MWIKVLLLAGAAWIFQGILSYFQIKNFQSKVRELKKKGRVGVGVVKGRFGKGVIVLFSTNDEIITDAQIMSGYTVFARFLPFDTLINQKIHDIKKIANKFEKQVRLAVLKAADSLEQDSKFVERGN